MPGAKILPSKTVIPPYDSPPTRPIGQPTLQASKDKFTKSLKLTNQPYSVQRQAKHLMRQLYMRTSQGNVPQVTLPSNCRLNLTAIRNQQLDLLHHPRYVHASLAYTRDLNSGIHFQELDLTLSRSGLPRPTRRSRPGSRSRSNPSMPPITASPFHSWMRSKRAWMRMKPLARVSYAWRVSQQKARTNPHQTVKNTETLLRPLIKPFDVQSTSSSPWKKTLTSCMEGIDVK